MPSVTVIRNLLPFTNKRPSALTQATAIEVELVINTCFRCIHFRTSQAKLSPVLLLVDTEYTQHRIRCGWRQRQVTEEIDYRLPQTSDK